MSGVYTNVELRLFDESSFTCRTLGTSLTVKFGSSKIVFLRNSDVIKEITLSPLVTICRFSQKTVGLCVRKNSNDVVTPYLVTFASTKDVADFLASPELMESGCIGKNIPTSVSTFDKRTDSWSAVQYFQFYSYLSQQQNMMQDFIRTSTYQRAVLANSAADFRGKVVLDVGAGSGILSFFAIQAGATRVYAVEASNMAVHCNNLVQANKLAGRIVVISGKIEEITIPEPVDVIISEPMGYMLYNERMLESYVHARKFLAPHLRQAIKVKHSKRKENVNEQPINVNCSDSDQSDDILTDELDSNEIEVEDGNHDEAVKLSNRSIPCPGIMFPTVANLYIVPFSDEALFAEQYSKANFWYQQSFHGMDLTALRNAAVTEYFNQPIVDTFDIGICPALPCVHKVDFRTVSEEELASIDVPLHYQITTCSTIHGLAFWFDVGFLGSQRDVWLSTAPTEPLTHWYQVRCLLGTPLFVQEGQSLNGHVTMRANSRQSYDVQIELIVPGSQTKITNNLDLKNPHFRYNGYPPAPPPGSHVRSPTETYYANLCLQQQQQLELQTQPLTSSNPLALAAAAAATGIGASCPGTINLRSNQTYSITPASLSATSGLITAAANANNLQTNSCTLNESFGQNQTQSMQLSPQPMIPSSMDIGTLISTAHAQMAPILKPSNAPISSSLLDSLTTVGAIGTTEPVYFNPGNNTTFGDSCFNLNLGHPSNGWRPGSFTVG